MKAAAFVQARLGSKRLPGKVLLPVGDRPLLGLLIDRIKACSDIGTVVVGTSPSPEDDAILEFCKSEGVLCSRHSIDDIVGRMHAALNLAKNAPYLIRLWGDSPLVCPDVISLALKKMDDTCADFLSTGAPRLSYPGGLDFEVYTPRLLARIHTDAKDSFHREFPYEYVKTHPAISVAEIPHSEDLSEFELSVDYASDLENVRRLYSDLNTTGKVFDFSDIRHYLKENGSRYLRQKTLPRNVEFNEKLNSRKK